MLAETGLQALNLVRPGRTRDTWEYLRGVGRFLRESLQSGPPSPGLPHREEAARARR
jgi:hypothetical protein